MSRPARGLGILLVNTVDAVGGAAEVARSLLDEYQAQGHDAWLAVGLTRTGRRDVFVLPNDSQQSTWRRATRDVSRRVRALSDRESGPLLWASRAAAWAAEPDRAAQRFLGREDFCFPGTHRLLDLPPRRPDIVHCHNLHGSFFDLRALPALSHAVPTVVSLHDAWLLSGHCAHPVDCTRWRTGCGSCPDLARYPSVRADATAFNWRRKRRIHRDSMLYVTTACRWLMDWVEASTLHPRQCRVIPNGVDLERFTPAERAAVRVRLGLPQDARIVLTVAHDIKTNIWKDYSTLEEAIGQLSKGSPLLFLCRGAAAAERRIGNVTLRFLPADAPQELVAQYYQAADLYVHPARVDTFPLVVLEALASGIPVVASAVGGIPEQVEEGRTGFLTPRGDASALAARTAQLMQDDALRLGMGAAARRSAVARFSLRGQSAAYLDWYAEILADRRIDSRVGPAA